MQAGTILPFVMIALFGGYYWYSLRQRKALAKEHSDKSLAVVGQRLGMAIQEGDPDQNLYVFQQPSRDFRRRAVLHGQPYGRPARLLLVDGQETQERLFSRVRTVSFGCFLEAPCPVQLPPFEVALRAANPYLAPPFHLDEVPGLREVSTGDGALDGIMRVVSTDPRLGQIIAPALRILASQSYVHLAGQAGTLTISVSRNGLPYFAAAPETYLLALETAACALEGRPFPAGAMGATASARPGGANAAHAAVSGQADTAAAVGAADPGGSEGVPMPCSQCGAPMQLVGGPYLHSPLSLVCAYCRQTETLPADATERVRRLQMRLHLLKQAREDDEAPLRTVAMVKRAWVPILIVFFLFIGYQTYMQISLFRSVRAVSPEGAQALLPSVGSGFAMFTGYLAGYLGMARGYRRAVKPLLRARPPKAAGLSARCRSCGGDLPSVNTPEANCRYCGATNLLDAELTRRASELLQAEIGAYQARANRVFSHDAFRTPMKAFYRWGGAGVVAGIALAWAAIGISVAVLDATTPAVNGAPPRTPKASIPNR